MNRRQRQRPQLPGDTANARFERTVRESFAFLVRHYGFRPEQCHTRDSEAWMMYSTREARVTVSRDHASGCKVTLTGPTPAGILRSDFGLDELEQEMAGAGRYAPKPSAALTLEESVAHRAEVLLAIGAEVLNGNFAMLVERQRRRQGAFAFTTETQRGTESS